jgi:arabinofuranan 3-O-arabinosyltransferase
LAAIDEALIDAPVRRGPRGPLPGHRARERFLWLGLAAISYVPLLFTAPGRVGADTKAYLYLDPGRLIQSAASMWDPALGMGTVPHQNIGYLLPMGPFYWVFHHLGVPAWVAQRLWLGSLLFLAGLGTAYLLRVLGVEGPARTVAALVYMLSPYLLDYAARISAILMPWSALPWMLALAVLSLRRGGWRYPAAFALVVATAGGVNATSILYAGLAPLLWFPYAVWGTKEATWRQALAAMARIGALTTLVSLWWIAGLWVQGAFGLDVLRYTETVPTVAKTSLSSEVLRGLGYWFFYGQDKLGPWIEPAVDYTQHLWLIAVSFLMPAAAFLAAGAVRWRYRGFFVGLVALGTVIAVGAYPYDHPSPLGSLFKAAGNGSTVGLAMRSTARAVPLVVLGLATLLGVGVSALAARWCQVGWTAAGLAGALAMANMYPLWAGQMIGGNLQRPENIPGYRLAAARYLDSRSKDPATGGYYTRVLGIPGEDFASYRWGNTVDTVEPGLMKRTYVSRELFPYGTAGTVDLINAFDSQLQEGTFVPSSLAPIARLISAGDVMVRSDLQFERYNTPRPKLLWAQLNPTPPGLTSPKGFGKPVPNVPSEFPMLDELTLAEPPSDPNPPPVAVFGVPGARPMVRSDPASRPLLVDGDGLGLVNAASTGLLDTDAAVIYSPSLVKHRKAMNRALAAGADLLVTDTNRKQARRWGTIRENTGYIETANEVPVPDPSDQRLPLFPGAGTNAYTVAQLRGVKSVTASAYGNNITYTPENRPANAFDSNPTTAWEVAAFGNPVGQWIRVTLQAPVTTDHLTLTQAFVGVNRWITQATITFDGGHPLTVALGPASHQPPGQEVRFPTRTFRTLQVTIDATNTGRRAIYNGLSGVGFSNIGIPGVSLDEVIRLPEDLLQAAGASSISHRLVILMDRQRTTPVPPRSDPEPNLVRTFDLPVGRSFSVSGTVRINGNAPDDVLDSVLGQDTHGIVATSSDHLPNDPSARASSAIDNNPSTFWMPGFGPQEGKWLHFDLPAPVTFDHLDLQVVADGRHSVPTQITVQTESGSRTVDVPPVRDRRSPNAVAAAPVRFPALTGRHITITIDSVRPVMTTDYYSGTPIMTPVGIRAGIPGVSVSPPPAQLPATCRSDLLSVDGKPVPVMVKGSTARALALDGLQLVPCGPQAPGLYLGGGNHLVRSANGSFAGLDVDQLALASARGGAPLQPTASGSLPAADPPVGPPTRVNAQDSTVVHATIANPGHPFWLVLGQSQDPGWSATVSGGRSLGQPVLIDGYANGWYVDPKGLPATIHVTMRFTPQSWVWAALVASGLGLLACSAIVAVTSWRRRARRARRAGPARAEAPELVSPLDSGGRRPPWGTVAAASGACGLAAALVYTPWAGPPVAALAALALAVGRSRLVLTLGSAGLVGLCGLYEIVQQYRYRFPPVFEWPTFFHLGNDLGWLAVILLATDAVVQALRGRGRPA